MTKKEMSKTKIIVTALGLALFVAAVWVTGEAWAISGGKLKVGDGVEVSGHWDTKGIFFAKSVKKLGEARRPTLRGVIEKISQNDSSFVLYGKTIQADAKTVYLAKGKPGGEFAKLKAGLRAEVTCYVTDEGTWKARKVEWDGVKPTDKIKGTVTHLFFHNQPPDTIEISGLKILVTDQTKLSGSTHYIEAELFSTLSPEEGEANLPHMRLGEQLLVSGDYVHSTRFENRYTLSQVQKDDYQETEPGLRLQAAGSWTPELQSFLQLRLRKKFTFGTFPYRPPTTDSTRFEFQAIEAYLLLRNPGGKGVALQVGKQRVRDQRRWFSYEYLDAARLYVYETHPIVLEASFLPSIFPLRDKKFKTWDDILLQAHYMPNAKNEARLYFLKRRDSSPRNREPVYWGLSYYGRPKYFLTGWLDASLLRGTDKQETQRAFALDVGSSLAAVNLQLRPSFTLGYAAGSGDKVSGDSISQEFRQTGYETNSGRFGGFANFQYYGEVLNPELANIKILTVGAGFRPHRLVSADAVFHTYRQSRLSTKIRLESQALIAPPVAPLANDKNLGWELDFVLGVQKIWQRLNIGYSFGLFNPGKGFLPRKNNAILNRVNIRVEF